METYKEYLKILELSENASLDDIKNARKELIKVWHPDRFENDENLIKRANCKTQKINEAYEYLTKNYSNEAVDEVYDGISDEDEDFSQEEFEEESNDYCEEDYCSDFEMEDDDDFAFIPKTKGKNFQLSYWVKVFASFIVTMFFIILLSLIS